MKKKIFILATLTFSSLMAFTGATYARFTKQYTPRVNGLTFNVATQENIMIAKDNGSGTYTKGTFKDSINFSELVDSSSINLNPLYGSVTDNILSINNSSYVASANSNYIKFSLYFSSSSDMDVYLNGDLSSVGGSGTGTVIEAINSAESLDGNKANKVISALRIGFVSYTTVVTPSSSGEVITYEIDKTSIYSTSVKTKDNYDLSIGEELPYTTFSTIGYAEGASSNNVILFSTNAKKVSKLDVYIWLEAKDKDCLSENLGQIFDTSIRINLGFRGVSESEESK